MDVKCCLRGNRYGRRIHAILSIVPFAAPCPAIRGLDTTSRKLKCHDANGETYYVTLSRDKVRISSYADDAIRATVEAWADEKPEHHPALSFEHHEMETGKRRTVSG
ncbi:hypothetical protein [Methanogenium organophilum]|uniref:Uncharacterized protein n=1 Tax=Methanogenium organophilum TaxID=2199 RepID=A0A9X9TA10_METOG|nr:hypothetical protein [Methanogenium organophilum]WAI02622.1 hypothetical protein OU421_02735 [Methanogenium organophilum]